MDTQELIVRKWILTSNIINVIAFVLFYFSKYIDSYIILYLSLMMFLLNGLLTLNYYFRTKKIREKSNNYRKLMNEFYMRLFFICFFLVFGIMILVGSVSI